MTHPIFFITFFNFVCIGLSAQNVKNDSIHNRIQLNIDSAFISSTSANCSVEWNCVDQKNLKDQVTFHNDQWFFFKPSDSGTFYLNVRNQSCQNNRGIQLLVIDGLPCEPTSYKYLKLHSKLSVEDIYYEIKGVEANKEYLILVDGLLGDVCQFEIGISSVPPNYAILPYPAEVKKTFLEVPQDKIIFLNWTLNRKWDDSTRNFIVVKIKDQGKGKVIKNIPLDDFSHLEHTQAFDFQDTLIQNGIYEYLILSETEMGKKYFFKNFYLDSRFNLQKDDSHSYFFTSNFKGNEKIRFQIFDLYSDRYLGELEEKNIKGKKYQINLSRYYRSGFRRYRIIIFYGNPSKKMSEETISLE